MRNQEKLRVTSEPTIPNNLHVDRDYFLSYVWDDDYFDRDKPTVLFSGKEILEAFRSIPESIMSSNKHPHEYKEHLHQLIKISGRVETNRDLSSTHCPELVMRATNAKAGYEDYREDLRKDMAVYVALNLDEVYQDDADMVSSINEDTEYETSVEELSKNQAAVLFIHDYDDGDLSYDPEELLPNISSTEQTYQIAMSKETAAQITPNQKGEK